MKLVLFSVIVSGYSAIVATGTKSTPAAAGALVMAAAKRAGKSTQFSTKAKSAKLVAQTVTIRSNAAPSRNGVNVTTFGKSTKVTASANSMPVNSQVKSKVVSASAQCAKTKPPGKTLAKAAVVTSLVSNPIHAPVTYQMTRKLGNLANGISAHNAFKDVKITLAKGDCIQESTESEAIVISNS